MSAVRGASLRKSAVMVTAALAIGGAALLAYLLIESGIAQVADALVAVGWGMLLVSALHLLPMVADTASWARLLHATPRPPFARLLYLRWIAESVNSLLPAAQVGGDLVRARLVMFAGVPGPVAAASVVADLTLGIVSQTLFTLLGLALALWLLGAGALPVAGPVLAGTLLALLLFATFYGAQRAGLFGLAARLALRLARSSAWASLTHHAEALDRALNEVYRRRADVAWSLAWTLLAWILGAGEVWLAFHLMGIDIGLAEALVLESVAQALRGAAFMVPGALGVLEGGVMLAAGLLGISPEAALAMALVKRVRELLLGIPGLLAWQAGEWRRLWRQRRSRPENDPA